MKRRNGFTMVELVILVAIAGVVAAVVLPLLARGRVAANESATIGDIRTLISAQAAYRTVNSGFYDANLECLTLPSWPGCIPSYPTSAPTFLDSTLASQMSKAGYHRSFQPGPFPPLIPATASPTSVLVYRYDATPATPGVTGVRGFAGASDERICFTADGAPVPAGAGPGTLPAVCNELR